jgi:threonylcarbamoyladenosine tRNA methylthiotransferase MtaB
LFIVFDFNKLIFIIVFFEHRFKGIKFIVTDSKTISFYTLGCRLNQAETAIIKQSLVQQGFQLVDFGQPCDIVVINTCTVTENGDEDTRRIINKINRESHPRIALIGCQAQTQGDRLLDFPGVHWVIGNELKMDLAAILARESSVQQLFVAPLQQKTFTIQVMEADHDHTRANLKIQDGCDFFCSYCEIPYARGRVRSREFDDLVRGAQQLAAAGHREIVLTGINIGLYCDEEKTLADVIGSLEEIPGLARIRLSSIENTTIPDSILARMTGNSKLCRFLHVPLQSGSDKILEAMNRKYKTAEFHEFVTRVRRTAPLACFGTDVIVGFPGETEPDFQQTYDFLEANSFSYFHVFSYSDRLHSCSRKFPAKVPRDIIARRSQKLRELSVNKRRRFMGQFIDRTEWVLFEQEKNGYWNGLTDTYIRVRVKSEKNLHNQLLPVHLDRAENQIMMGHL